MISLNIVLPVAREVTMRRIFGISGLLVLALATSMNTTSCKSGIPTDTPGVDELGQYVLRQKGPEIEIVLGYRFAAGSIADDWMILEVAMTAPPTASTTVHRESVWVKKPDGTKIPVASQTLFGQAYGEMRRVISKANINRDPLDYFPPSRQPCNLDFFVAPGRGVSHDQVSFNNRRVCQGRLFFRVPGGITPGRWVFGIDLEETTVRIPFGL